MLKSFSKIFFSSFILFLLVFSCCYSGVDKSTPTVTVTPIRVNPILQELEDCAKEQRLFLQVFYYRETKGPDVGVGSIADWKFEFRILDAQIEGDKIILYLDDGAPPMSFKANEKNIFFGNGETKFTSLKDVKAGYFAKYKSETFVFWRLGKFREKSLSKNYLEPGEKVLRSSRYLDDLDDFNKND